MKKVWALVVAAVLLLMVGCTGKGPGTSPDEGKTTVRESGFTLASGGVTVSGPAGVAPAGTEILAEEISAPTELTELGLAGSPVLDLSLAGDLQPQQPVTLTWKIPENVAPESVAFITSDGPGEPWRGVPVTIAGDQAQVQVDHFSLFAFLDGFKLIRDMYDASTTFLGQRYDPPQPCAQKVSVNGSDITLENSRTDYVHSCLALDDDKVVVTVASNSPYVFPIKGQTYATGRPPGTRTSAEAMVTAAVAKAIHRDAYPGFVLQGDRVEVEYAAADLIRNPNQQVVAGSFDQALALVGVAVVGLKMLAPGSSFENTAELVGVGECIAAIPQISETRSSSDVGASVPKIMDCLVAGIGAVGGDGNRLSAGVAVIGSLSGALINQFRGIGDQLSGSDFVITTTAKPGQVDDLTAYKLETSGLGPLRIGMPTTQLVANKWATKQGYCLQAPKIERQGVQLFPNATDEGPAGSMLGEIMVSGGSRIQTASGARVGMTVGQLKRIYGNRLQIDAKADPETPREHLIVRAGKGEIVFLVYSGSVRSDSSVVEAMLARNYSNAMAGGC